MKDRTRLQGRRKLLQGLVAGGGVWATQKAAPPDWKRPVVDSVILPAHAQASLTVTCEANPPSGTPVLPGESIAVLVTVSPNPGPGQPVQVEGFCDDAGPVFSDTLQTNEDGEIEDTGTAGFCESGQVACVRYTFNGVSHECCWPVEFEAN